MSGEASVGEHVGKETPVGGRMPITPLPSTKDVHLNSPEVLGIIAEAQAQDIEAKDVKDFSLAIPEDQALNSEPPPPTDTNVTENVRDISNLGSQSEENMDANQSENIDYFGAKALRGSNITDFARNMSGSAGSPHGHLVDSLRPESQKSGAIDWKEFSTQTVIGPTFQPGSTRPTSVPNFQSTSRRRKGPDYPAYPDQSFLALQREVYPPPCLPSSSPSLRTRGSYPSQNFSVSSTDMQSVRDLPQASSGAKTVGNTPAQSPGLFSPMFPTRRQWVGGSDDGHSNTPMLHPSHNKPPKETHKLLKDIDPISGRKTINHYEILQKLGSGQHGTVKQGRDLDTGELVAIKIVRRFSKKLRLGRSGDPNDMIKKEVAILKKARHPHVVSLIEVIDDDEFGKVYLVLEYVERGEIIWRKKTDKDIAVFEMERTNREAEQGFDNVFDKGFETDFMKAVEKFNLGAPVRRLEKARLRENQIRQAKERLKAERSHIQGHRSSLDPFWSLEFASEPENDYGSDTSYHAETQYRHDLQQGHDVLPAGAADGSPQSDTPSHTPKPLPYPINPELVPVGVLSRPETPPSLEGTMRGAHIEESTSDLALQATLSQIMASQTQWTAEEEDYRYVPCLTLSQALDAFRDTVLGLEYLHYQGIIHRDIKPANLLWTQDYHVKISDFGVSYLGKPIREDDNHDEIAEADPAILDEAIELAKTVGTPAFYAPELCDPQYFEVGRHPERPAITGQIDVWALGVTLYAMIFGRLPFVHSNEFQMYEKIAREEVFIPKWRLRGVEHTDKTPSNHNKRMDDIIEYEEVPDTLRDLLQRLLRKHPSERMKLVEVKHHPWVLQGISNIPGWMEETDPSKGDLGKKIEVSTQEVQDAVVGLTVLDRVKASFQRVGSVLRGRGSRKRTDSNPKHPESSTSTSCTKGNSKDHRRTSLRGDEQIYSALRASRECSEHPLSQSVAASPEPKREQASYFEDNDMRPASEPQILRPILPDRVLSTADSMKTIRGPIPATVRDPNSSSNISGPIGDFSSLTPIVDLNSSSSSLGGIFGGAGRRFVNTMRSRERGTGRQSPSQSSRSSSVDTNIEDPHAFPSLALSPAIAAGHVDQPPALRQEPDNHPLHESSSESFRRAQEQNYRRATQESHRTHRRSTVLQAAELPCPPSPDDETFLTQQRPESAAGSIAAFQISSSSEQIVSGDSTAHSRIPSVVSGASSLSATVEADDDDRLQLALAKQVSPPTIGRRSGSRSRQQDSEELNPTSALAKAAAEDEAGYNGEGEQESDSEDEGLAMA